MKNIRIIGAGRAGKAFAGALQEVGYRVDGPYSHSSDLREMSHGTDILILAVPDRSIAETAKFIEPDPDTLVVHLSGATDIDALFPHPRRAVLHPFAPLPDPVVGKDRLLSGMRFAVSGDIAVSDIVHDLGGRIIHIDDSARVLYHAAGCIAANHLVALMSHAGRVGALAGLDMDALLDLARFTLDDIHSMGVQDALTGPASRGDKDTIARHLAALNEQDRAAYLAELQLIEQMTRHVPQAPGFGHGEGVRTTDILLQESRGTSRDASRDTSSRTTSRVTSSSDTSRDVEVVDQAVVLQRRLEESRSTGMQIGLVPTMGALHAGHGSLIERARRECDVVVVTIFVNPLQFNDHADLDRYPRTLEEDLNFCQEYGADIVFVPSVEEMYPGYPAPPSSVVHVSGVTEILEGTFRPGHFDGVATVVAKLFAIAGRCKAYFGEKDYQQIAVVRELVREMLLPVEVVPCPTVREADGLAMSSRNRNLSPKMRKAALSLYRALLAGEKAICSRAGIDVAKKAMVVEMEKEEGVLVEYAEIVYADSFVPVGNKLSNDGERIRLLVAAKVGDVRLIDNIGVQCDHRGIGRI